MESTDASESRVGTAGDPRPEISAYSTTEERTVFTESGNGDGWIATDFVVEPTQ